MQNNIPPIEELDYKQWTTPVETLGPDLMYGVLYMGKFFEKHEWESSDEKKEYEHNRYKHDRYYITPKEIDPDYKNNKNMKEIKSLLKEIADKPIEQTIYNNYIKNTKFSIF